MTWPNIPWANEADEIDDRGRPISVEPRAMFQGNPEKKPSGLFTPSTLPQDGPLDAVAWGTGWWELNEIYRMYPGQFTVCSGIPGHGKTTFWLNILCNLAKDGRKSFLYVPENEGFLVEQLLSISGQPVEELDKSLFIQTANPAYYEHPRSLGYVLALAGEAIEAHGITVVYIDPWNELERLKPKDQMLTDYIGEALAELKAFARVYQVAVVLVAHPTKAIMERGAARTPSLYDIESSAHWANKSDNGLIINRDDDAKHVEIISCKVRRQGAGKVGRAIFNFDPVHQQFSPQYGAVT